MNLEEIREYCLSFPGVTEGFPFDLETLVFKVMGKMFCLLSLETEHCISLKNTPERIPELQEEYTFVLPGYHMNKNHWMRVQLQDPVMDTLLKDWISTSYSLVVAGLPVQKREELKKIIQNERI